jgi:hypothetical protein
MSGTNGSPGKYRVEMTGPALLDAKTAARSAEERGAGDKFRDAVARIWSRLERDPIEFGEPMYELRAMKMEVRKAAVAPVYVEYGVHKDEPLVVIRRVRWLGNPSG